MRLFGYVLIFHRIANGPVLLAINCKGVVMSAQSKEVLELVKAIPPAVDAFEARITEILKQAGADTPETQADLAEAKAVLLQAIADAADGVDEASTPPEPGPEPEPTPGS